MYDLEITQKVRAIVQRRDIRLVDKLRVAMLFLLRFPSDPLKTKLLVNDLEANQIPKASVAKVKEFCERVGKLDVPTNSGTSGLDSFLKVSFLYLSR